MACYDHRASNNYKATQSGGEKVRDKGKGPITQ
jgi:hypothetical protein